MHISSYLSHLLLLLPVALSAHIRISIPSSPNPSTLPPSTSASLTTLSTQFSAPLRVDGSFDFRNVTTGSYLLDVHCNTHAFAPLRVDVREAENDDEEVLVWGTFRGNEWENKGPVVGVRKLGSEEEGGEEERVWGFEVKALGGKEYFVQRAGFSPLSILKNPMILLALVSMGIVFGMPYLMDNMDPELRAEFEERQKASPLAGGQAANPLQSFDAAAWLAGSSSSGTKKSEGSGTRKIEVGVSR